MFVYGWVVLPLGFCVEFAWFWVVCVWLGFLVTCEPGGFPGFSSFVRG